MFEVEEITFDDIMPVWEHELWPGRTSSIQPVSSMMYRGGYDMSIYIRFKATFFGVKHAGKLIAVNSGHRTHNDYYRSRGLYVNSEFRRQGLAKLLLLSTVDKGRDEGSAYSWSMPRKGSEAAYVSAGYNITSGWFDEKVEFGPNCYVLQEL